MTRVQSNGTKLSNTAKEKDKTMFHYMYMCNNGLTNTIVECKDTLPLCSSGCDSNNVGRKF